MTETSRHAGSAMNFRLLNLYLMIFWLLLSASLFGREYLFPNANQDPARAQHLTLLAYVALGLAAWNGIRWWVLRMGERKRAATEESYYRRVAGGETPEEKPVTDPQFSFENPPPPTPSPPPPANGESH